MPSETSDWSVPASARALLWWPAVAFVLVIVAPDAGIGLIIVAGGVLVVLGAVLPRIGRRLVRRAATGDPQTVAFRRPALDGPTAETSHTEDERAA